MDDQVSNDQSKKYSSDGFLLADETVPRTTSKSVRWVMLAQAGIYGFPILLGIATDSWLAGLAAYGLAACTQLVVHTSATASEGCCGMSWPRFEVILRHHFSDKTAERGLAISLYCL